MSVNRAVIVQQPQPMMMMPQQPVFQPVMQQVMVPGHQGAVIEEDFDDDVAAEADASSRSGRSAPPGPSYDK